jgi:hypothetical protein
LYFCTSKASITLFFLFFSGKVVREYPSASEGQVFALVADTRGLLISGHKGTQVTCFTGTTVQILTLKALHSSRTRAAF